MVSKDRNASLQKGNVEPLLILEGTRVALPPKSSKLKLAAWVMATGKVPAPVPAVPDTVTSAVALSTLPAASKTYKVSTTVPISSQSYSLVAAVVLMA